MAAKSCQYRVRPVVPKPASSLINRNFQTVGTALSQKKMFLGVGEPGSSCPAVPPHSEAPVIQRACIPKRARKVLFPLVPEPSAGKWEPVLGGLGVSPLWQPGHIFITFSGKPKVEDPLLLKKQIFSLKA